MKLVDLVWMELVEEIAVDQLDFSLVHVVFEAKDGHDGIALFVVPQGGCLKAGYIS